MDAWLAVRAVGEAGMEGLYCCDFGGGLESDVEEAAEFEPGVEGVEHACQLMIGAGALVELLGCLFGEVDG